MNMPIIITMRRLIFFLLIASCAGAQDKAQPKLPTANLAIAAKNGTVMLTAELARSVREQQTGLMFRAKLDDGEGMLFIFERDRILSFWMKNTLIPLSIAYLDRGGVIREIHDMKAGQLNSTQSARSLRYALEVPLGWFERAGVSIGDSVDLSGAGDE